jgi:putative ABC transport system permease protein
LAVRAALGAGRGRLMRQLLTENLLLAGLGGVAGMAVTGWAINILAAFNTMPRLRPIELDGRVLGIALVVSLLTGLTFGLLPAWQAGRARVNEALTQGGQSSTAGQRGRRLRGALVVLEVALAVVLLSGAGLMVRSVVQLLRVDPGFDPVNLRAVRPDFTGRASGGNEKETRNVFTAQLHERLANLPGVSAVGVFKDNYQDEKFVPEGRPETVMLNGAHCGLEQSDYFRTARIPLVAGRYLERGDIGQQLGTVIVNETLAELCWPGQSAVGKTFRAVDRRDQPTYTIVGVVRDSRISSFDEKIRPIFYRPYQESSVTGSALTFVVRTQNDPANLTSAIRREIRALNPDMRQPWISVYRQTLYDATAAQRTYRNYLMGFAAVGLVLSALGIYGVLAYSVARRTREIGIRMAVGAERRHVMNMVVGEGARLIFVGVVLGLVAAFWLTKLLQRQLFNVSPHDPVVLAAVIGVLVVVALVACWLPARRAAKVDPMVALRAE